MSRQVPKVVPWSSESELQEIRELFYNGDKLQALSRVKVLESRGSLPPSIESTSLLMSAIINDNPQVDSYNIRCAYSMALVRFVNGQLDPFQRGEKAIPLTKLAQLGGLPAFFVELRHTATHENLPSLEFLRDSCARALDWLWERYWSVNAYEETVEVEDESRKKLIKESFREWRRERRGDLFKTFKPGDNTPEGLRFWNLVKTFETYRDEDEELLMEVMYKGNVMIPSDSKKVQSHVKLLSPLLDLLNKDGFIQRLVVYGLDMLNSQGDGTPRQLKQNNSDNNNNNEKMPVDSIVEWLKYFITPRPKNKPWIDNNEFAKQVVEKPRPWNVTILKEFNIDKYTQLANEMESLFNTNPTNKRKLEEIDTDMDSISKKSHIDSNSSNSIDSMSRMGWQVVPNWQPRALGVL